MGRETGFTIIELITVIVIIGVLLTVAVAVQNGVLPTSRDSERAEDMASIARVLEGDYLNQTVGSASYPAMNVFVADAKTSTGTAARTDIAIFTAPNDTKSSLLPATTTDSKSPNGDGSPQQNEYFYQALTASDLLCKDASQTCTRYRLFYRQESGAKSVVILKSGHQQ